MKTWMAGTSPAMMPVCGSIWTDRALATGRHTCNRDGAETSGAARRQLQILAPDCCLPEGRDKGEMRVALLGAQPGHERRRSHPNDHGADGPANRLGTDFDENELSLPGADQVEIDLCQQLGVEQGAVFGAP